MEYSDVFHLISSVCNKSNVSCVLIGDFAVNYHKVARQAADAKASLFKDLCLKYGTAELYRKILERI